MKEEETPKSISTCSEIPSDARFDINCPDNYIVPESNITEFTFSVNPIKQDGLYKCTLEFKCADPGKIKEIYFK